MGETMQQICYALSQGVKCCNSNGFYPHRCHKMATQLYGATEIGVDQLKHAMLVAINPPSLPPGDIDLCKLWLRV